MYPTENACLDGLIVFVISDFLIYINYSGHIPASLDD